MATTTHRKHLFGIAVVLPLAASLLFAAPVSAANRGIHLAIGAFQFSGGTCLNPDCSLLAFAADGVFSSNIDGVFTDPPGDKSRPDVFHSDLIGDFSPGGTCNIIDERVTFTFAAGSVFVHSHHEDCRLVGLRINTPFTITGGTGTFSGASGGGREFTPAKAGPYQYDGQISY